MPRTFDSKTSIPHSASLCEPVMLLKILSPPCHCVRDLSGALPRAGTIWQHATLPAPVLFSRPQACTLLTPWGGAAAHCQRLQGPVRPAELQGNLALPKSPGLKISSSVLDKNGISASFFFFLAFLDFSSKLFFCNLKSQIKTGLRPGIEVG